MTTHPAAFRRYLAGQLPSVTCSWAQVVALAWVVVHLDPRALGWVMALQFLPSLVLGPWFGAVADRYDRRGLLIAAEAGLGLVALAYTTASGAGVLTLPVVYLLAMAWGVLNALDTPARRALVPMLVPPERAARAAATAGTVMLLGMTAGSALGGVLVASAGVTVAFGVNAASFLADVVVLATIRTGPSPRVARAPHQIRDGLRYVWRSAALRNPLLVVGVLGTFALTLQVSLPVLMEAGFGGGPGAVGAAFTAATAGSLAGAVAAAVHGAPGPRTLRPAIVLMALALAVTAVAPTVAAALTGLVGVGVGWSVALASAIAVLQTADPRMMGRVMALFGMVLLGGSAAGGPVAAALVATAGPRAPFAVGAAVAVAGFALAGRARTRPVVALPGPSGGGMSTLLRRCGWPAGR